MTISNHLPSIEHEAWLHWDVCKYAMAGFKPAVRKNTLLMLVDIDGGWGWLCRWVAHGKATFVGHYKNAIWFNKH